MLVRMDCHGISETGRVRETNEDQFLIADLCKSMRVHHTSLGLDDQCRLFGHSQGRLLLVADGMGGHAAGGRASRLAVDSVATYLLNTSRWFLRLEEDSDQDFVEDLVAAMEACQERLRAVMEASPKSQGMGTTLTMAYVVWPRAYIVHIGDSRCYLHRDNYLEQITRDHTLAQEMIDEGAITPKESLATNWSDVLWNVIGGSSEDLLPEVYKVNLQVGDTLLLATDGLVKHVSEQHFSELLAHGTGASSICRQLLDAANQAGGTDNATVVVARLLANGQAQVQQWAAAEPASPHAPTGEQPTLPIPGEDPMVPQP